VEVLAAEIFQYTIERTLEKAGERSMQALGQLQI